MLPHVDLMLEDRNEFLSFQFIGDVIDLADKLSMDIFQQKKNETSNYDISGVEWQIVAKAIAAQNLQGIPFDQQQKFLAFSSDRQQFKRSIIFDIISDPSNSLNLTENETILLKGLLSLAPLVDELFIAWREQVVYSDLGKSFLENPESSTEFRKKHALLTTPYVFSVIQEKEGTYIEQPLIEAFPPFVKRIVEELRKLSRELVLHDTDREITDYLNAWADFYENTDVNAYEFLSKSLDALWVQVTGRIIPVHAMEVYEDPGKYIVSPELGIAIIDERFDKVNNGIEGTRTKLISYLSKRYPESNALRDSIPLMQKAKACAYIMAAEAGARLVLRPFGQNIPNWDEVRYETGVRILITMATAKTRWVGERQALATLLGEEVVHDLYDPYVENGKLFDYAAMVFVGGHEIAHNAFITPGLKDRISPPIFAKLEEAKASLSIVSAIDDLYDNEEQKVIAMYRIGYSLVKMQQVDEPSVIAYVYECFVILQSMLEVGILDATGNLDLSEEKVSAWIKKLKVVFDELVRVYETGTTENAMQYIATYFTPTGDIKEIMAKL